MKRKIIIIVVILVLLTIGSILIISNTDNTDNKTNTMNISNVSTEKRQEMIAEIAELLLGDDPQYHTSDIDSGIPAVDGVTLYASGIELEVYVYNSEEEAEYDINCFDKTGYSYLNGTKVSAVSWIDKPHFYLYKNCMLIYIGKDEEILSYLANRLGNPIVG